MALKQMILKRKIEERSKMIAELRTQEKESQKRSKELSGELERAANDEEIDKVALDAEELQIAIDQVAADIATLETEKADLQAELDAINENDSNTKDSTENISDDSTNKTVGGTRNMTLKTRLRTAIHNSEEVRSFYQGLQTALMEKRALTNQEKALPVEVQAELESLIGDYSTLYNEIDLYQFSSPGRVLIPGTIPSSAWESMTGATTEIADTITPIELDNWMLSGAISVPNAIISDALVDLAAFVTQRLAQSIAKTLDLAILKGGGTAKKEPKGIIPALPAGQKKDIADFKLATILSNIGLLKVDGTEGEILFIMSRKTYYAQLLPQLLVLTAQGVAAASYQLPFRVVFSAHMDDDAILIGSLKQYVLAQRQAATIESSTEHKFLDNVTVFKGVSRWDGAPKSNTAFALLNLKNP